MSISVTCPQCEAQGKVPPEHAGLNVTCPKCKHSFAVVPPKGSITVHRLGYPPAGISAVPAPGAEPGEALHRPKPGDVQQAIFVVVGVLLAVGLVVWAVMPGEAKAPPSSKPVVEEEYEESEVLRRLSEMEQRQYQDELRKYLSGERKTIPLRPRPR